MSRPIFFLASTILSFCLIIVCKTFLHESLIESCVHGGLFFLKCLIPSNLGRMPIRNYTLQLTTYNLQGCVLLLKTCFFKYWEGIFIELLQRLPPHIKVSLYKALFLFLLQPLLIVVVLFFSITERGTTEGRMEGLRGLWRRCGGQLDGLFDEGEEDTDYKKKEEKQGMKK